MVEYNINMNAENRVTIIICSFVSLILSVFFIYNLTTFLEGSVISSPWFDNGINVDETIGVGLFSITIGWIGGTLGTLSVILLIRNIRSWYYFTITGQVLTIIDSLITGMFITSISYVIMIVLIILSLKKKITYSSYLLMIMITLMWFCFGFTFYYLTSGISLIPIIDVIASGISFSGWILISYQKKEGYILFIINDLMYLIAFGIIGLIVTSIAFVVYMSINLYCLIKLIRN